MKLTIDTAYGSVKPIRKPEDFKQIERQAREEHARRVLRKMRGGERGSKESG